MSSKKPPKGKKGIKDRFKEFKKNRSDKKNAEFEMGVKKKLAETARFRNVKSGSSTSAPGKIKKNKYEGMSGKELRDAEFKQKARKQKKMQKNRKDRSDTLKELRGG